MKQSTQTDNYEEIIHDIIGSPIIQKRQLGKFQIKSYLLGASQPIFENVLVIRCEHLAAYNVYEYYAYSGAFRPVPFGEMIPEYVPNIYENHEDPTATFVTFEEI
jgi:hypothetical protein